jgi:hypothetical protein
MSERAAPFPSRQAYRHPSPLAQSHLPLARAIIKYLSTLLCACQRKGGLRFMEELYLILHKVRGQAAIDVATRIHLSGGDCIWWIPTSGHRAWPLRWQPLTESLSAASLSAVQIEGDDWERLPDHYPHPKQRKSLVARLRARLRTSLTAWVLREIWRVRAKRDHAVRS